MSHVFDNNSTVSSSKSCLVNAADGSIHLDKSHAYYYQVQTQIFICKVEYCDFCVCTFPEAGPSIHIERIYPDSELWQSCIERTTHFFKVCILPELLGKWYTRPYQFPSTSTINLSQTATLPSLSELEPLYCYCRQPEPKEGASSSQMIACDNPLCSLEWFHTKCLKLKSIPKGKWYCPDCRKLPDFLGKKRKKEE